MRKGIKKVRQLAKQRPRARALQAECPARLNVLRKEYLVPMKESKEPIKGKVRKTEK